MNRYGRRLIIPLDFEKTVCEVNRALRAEGLEVIGRIDVRDHIRRNLRRDFRQYIRLEAWSPEAAFEALQQQPDLGLILPVRLAIYESTASETIVVAEVLSSRRLLKSRVGEQENARIGRVLHRLEEVQQGHCDESAA